MKHALLSPSSSHRWIPCPGSVAMSKDEPNSRSKYSDEGTAAHFLASTVLDDPHNLASHFIGKWITVWEHPESDSSGTDWSANLAASAVELDCESFEVDDAMAEAVQAYVDSVREFARHGTLLVEQRLSIASITGEDEAEGTSDAVVIVGEELQVHDLKYGMGIQVDATDNSQLKIYALAALEEFGFMADFKRVRLVIHQPRLNHLSEWDCSVEDLQEWAEQVVAPAAQKALHYYYYYTKGLLVEDADGLMDFDLHAGDHCRSGFCPARGTCPAHDEYVMNAVGADFENLDEIKAVIAEVKKDGSETSRIDPVKLGIKLRAVDLIEDWCTAVRARAEGLLLQNNNDAATIGALGFKLVQGRKGARAWKDEAAAEVLLKSLRLKADEMYSKKLISPTQAEKVLKDQPKKWEKVIPIFEQRDGKPSVAPLSDKRLPLVITPVIESFEDLEGKDLV